MSPTSAPRHLVVIGGGMVAHRLVAVLVGDQQVAPFRVRAGRDELVHAVGHRDPFCGGNVIARGIVGSVAGAGGERDTVASPMYKHVFDVATGECLTEPGAIPVHRTFVAGGVVHVHPVPVGTDRG